MVVTNAVEADLKQRTSGPRIFALDALRGIAALVVACHHLRLCFFSGEPRWFLRPFFAGTASVVVFFVLSGYVLSIPYWKGRQLGYGSYLTRRFFRIYVPYAAALLLALLIAQHELFSRLPLTPWFYKTWQTRITLPLVLRHLLTIPGTAEINTAIWSLRYEMEMSILLPLICRLILRVRGWWPLAATLGISICGRTLESHASPLAPLQAELGFTLLWISFFLYGILLAWQQKPIGEFYARLPRTLRAGFALMALLVFASPRLMLLPAAACILILTAQYTPIKRLLTTAIPEYLGRISYSLYLVHGTVLYTVVILGYGKMPLYLLVVLFFCTTLAISHLFCICVEEPANLIGRSVTRSRGDRLAAQARPALLSNDSPIQ